MRIALTLLAAVFIAGCAQDKPKNAADSGGAVLPGSGGGGGSASGPVTDHQVGNGGGGICIAGACTTMAEAGLRINGRG
jgi:hypothetical protein